MTAATARSSEQANYSLVTHLLSLAGQMATQQTVGGFVGAIYLVTFTT